LRPRPKDAPRPARGQDSAHVKGVDPHVIQQLGGWADLHTANLYTGKLTKAMREAVDALAEDLE